MKRRRKGTGTIEALPDGRFRPRLPIGTRQRLEPCATEEEATRMLDAAVAELADGTMGAVGGETVRAFGESVIDERERTGTRSAKTDRSRWATHVATWECAEWPLRAVSSADGREWLAEMFKKNAKPGCGQKSTKRRRLSATTIQNTLNLFRVVFQVAVERGLVPANPMKDIRLPRGAGKTHEPWTYLVPEEQEKLLACEAIPEGDRLLIAFALGTGLRQGELWNLELRDVRIDEGKIVVRFGSRGKATKSGRIRRVPLFGMARKALDRWLVMLETLPNPHGLLFPLPSGARRQKGKRPKGWAEWLTAAGIVAVERHDGRAVRWHDLRHTCGSSLVAGWWGRRWALIEVRDMLGHRSVTTTERYAHLSEDALDAAARETDTATSQGHDSENSHEASSKTMRNDRAPPARLERTTFGLGNLRNPESASEVSSVRGLILDLSGRAKAALEAIADGDPAAWARATAVLAAIVEAGAAAGSRQLGRRSA